MKKIILLALIIIVGLYQLSSLTTTEIIDKYIRFDDWEGARSQLESYLQHNGSDAYAHSLYSSVLNELSRYDDAITSIRKAITLESSGEKKGEMFFNLGNFYYNKGSKDAAIEMYKKASVYNPIIAQPYYMTGLINYEKGQNKECIVSWKKYVALSTNLQKKQKIERILGRFEKKLLDDKQRIEDEKRRKQELLDKLKKELENSTDSSNSMNDFNIKSQKSEEDFEEID